MSEGFVHWHWYFVAAAYGVIALGLGGLIAYTLRRLDYWSKRAREEAEKR